MATVATADSALEAYRRALESHDADAILGLYSDDAVVVSYSERNRPSSAQAFDGRTAIEAWIRDFMSRNLTHTIANEVVGDDRFAYTETCLYPTGERVISACVCDVRGGKIVRQTGVEAWDE